MQRPGQTSAAAVAIPWARLLPLLLAALAFALAFWSPVRVLEGSDPRGALFVAQLLLRSGDVRLDAYPQLASDLTYRVAPINGHLQYNFPLGTSILAAPFVGAANLLGMDMARAEDDAALQNLLSALTTAGAAALGYALCRYWLRPLAAAAVSAAMLFGTSLITTMGTALWSTNIAVLLTLGSLLLVARPSRLDTLGPDVAAGALLALAYLTRPTMLAVGPALLLSCALARRWRAALGLALGAAPILAAFLIYAQLIYGQPLPPYYQASRLGAGRIDMTLIGVAGHLVSPARGVLIWSPQLGLTLAGVAWLWPRLRGEPLAWAALVWLGLHLYAISSFPHWWGGLGYGNRLAADITVPLLLLAALAWRAAGEGLANGWRRAAAAAFLSLATLGAAIHAGNGLLNQRSLDWNFWGRYTVDNFPMMLFDWRYPPFLASQPALISRGEEYRRSPPQPNELFGRPVFPVAQLRYDPLWAPEQVAVAPGLAAMLDESWFPYEPGWGARWMRGEARIWLAADRPTSALIRLTPAAMNVDGRSGDHGDLIVTLDGRRLWSGPIATGATLELVLPLGAGTTDLQLALAAGEARLGDDPRPLAVAFHSIEVVGLR